MPIPKACEIKLSLRQKERLIELSRRRKNEHQLVIRAKIILAASTGLTNKRIAEQLSIGRSTVTRWRTRWNQASSHLTELENKMSNDSLTEQIIAVLCDDPRSGAPAKFTAEQICQILALACRPPMELDIPVSHWTPRELAFQAISRGIVAEISPRHIGRFFLSGGVETTSSSLLA